MSNEEETLRLMESLQGNESVEDLNFRGCQFQSEAAQILSEYLESTKSLTALSLLGTGPFDPESLERISRALEVNSTLIRLDLRSLKKCGADWCLCLIFSSMFKANKSLRSFLYDTKPSSGIDQLASCLMDNQFLVDVSLESLLDGHSKNTIFKTILSRNRKKFQEDVRISVFQHLKGRSLLEANLINLIFEMSCQ
jgi:hypothetical protein